MAAKDFPHASTVEGLRFTAQVAVSNVIQGLFRRRRTAVALATRIDVDGRAVSFMSSLKRSYGDGPLWIRVVKDEALLILGAAGIRRVLEASPDPFAADPEPKKSAMVHFQPDALTISRQPEWEDRRRFNEAVLDTGKPVHRLGDRFAAVSVQEAAALPNQLDWAAWNRTVRRVTRRIVLGDAAADDDQLSAMLGELMGKSNPPGHGDPELLRRYTARLEPYVHAAARGSLVGLIGEAPVTERTNPGGQVTHWLFALGDTLAINALRCLALLATDDAERECVLEELASADPRSAAAVAALERLEACLQEAMRLWPTTPILARVTVRDSDWDGVAVSAGTQILIVNTFNHRDSDAIDFADRFDPGQWVSGPAREDWQFNHFSHGPQVWPGAALAVFVATAMLATLLRDREVRLLEPSLEPTEPLPHALDFFRLKFEMPAR